LESADAAVARLEHRTSGGYRWIRRKEAAI